MSDDLKAFAILVRKLREAQVEFFKTRQPDRRRTLLFQSKELERQVDKRVEEILDQEQGKLGI